jgi:hypothetical protein
MLSATTALVGHDGWGDGRLADYQSSGVELNDFFLIKELSGISRQERLRRIQALGDEAGQHFQKVLPKALGVADHVVVLTHVPPFVEATWYGGSHSGPDWLPFFACKAVGDALRKAMGNYSQKRMTVLCGHTHGRGVSHVLTNLVVYTGLPVMAGRQFTNLSCGIDHLSNELRRGSRVFAIYSAPGLAHLHNGDRERGYCSRNDRAKGQDIRLSRVLRYHEFGDGITKHVQVFPSVGRQPKRHAILSQLVTIRGHQRGRGRHG